MRTLILLSIVIFASCKSGGRNKTPEELGETLFHLFKAEGKMEQFQPYLANKEDLIYLANHNKLADHSLEQVTKNGDEMVSSNNRRFAEDLERTYDNAKSAGVDWKSAKFSEVELGSWEEEGVQMNGICIVFTCGEQKHGVQFEFVAETERGWLLFDSPEYEAIRADGSH